MASAPAAANPAAVAPSGEDVLPKARANWVTICRAITIGYGILVMCWCWRVAPCSPGSPRHGGFVRVTLVSLLIDLGYAFALLMSLIDPPRREEFGPNLAA